MNKITDKRELLTILLADFHGDWAEFSLIDSDYEKARERLNVCNGGCITVEDVYAESLLNGRPLIVRDIEGDGESLVYAADLFAAYEKEPFDIDTYDSEDVDTVIQTAVFDEVIYG